MSQIIKQLSDDGLDKINNDLLNKLNTVSASDVEHQLSKSPGKYDFNRLLTLLSPAAQNYLEPMAAQARDLTLMRFGRTIQLYAPLYVSNFCVNTCKYCGYNTSSNFTPTRLTIEQALADADVIASEGFRHILLVSGHDTKHVTVDYLAELARKLRDKFSSITVEIYQLETDEYKKLFDAGVDGVTLYQETYNRDMYAYYHPSGLKSDYEQRLSAHDATATAGMRKLGLGFLLGLNDWRMETIAMAEHAAYLMKKYWRSQVSFSFPRMRPSINVAEQYKYLVTDSELVQMMLALRLCFADSGIVLSTRESAEFRDNMINICVTQISAGSKTNPGGYSSETESAEQFVIDDARTPAQMAEVVKKAGKEVVWKDWDKSFTA